MVEPHLANRPNAVVTPYGWVSPNTSAVWIAECAERGTNIVTVQEGGIYHLLSDYCVLKHAHDISDFHATWGWDRAPKAVPLPMCPTVTNKIRTSKHAKKVAILWFATIGPRYTVYLASLQKGPQHLEYFRNQRALYEAIDKPLKDRIIFRLDERWADRWSLRHRLAAAYPSLQFTHTTVPMDQDLANARMVIVDAVGATSFLQVLSRNIPVILYRANSAFVLSADAIALFDEMAEVGVYHETAASAACAIAEAYRDVSVWWQQPSRQRVIREVRNILARTSPDGVGLWASFLLSLSRRPTHGPSTLVSATALKPQLPKSRTEYD